MKYLRFFSVQELRNRFSGICLLILQVSLMNVVHAQPSGSFEIQINLGLETYELACYVPSGYNPQNPHYLIVGMHGGGGSGKGYRSHLVDVAESWPAVVVCPDNNGNSFSGPGEQLLLKAIDTALQMCNIDPNRVVLNGFSMNGFQAYRLGLQPLYPFYGFIPYNAVIQIPWISQLNLGSNVPACICEGSLDFYLSENLQVFDSLTANGTRAYFNILPGTAHDLDTAFPPAILRCMQVIDSIQFVTGARENLIVPGTSSLYPNPAMSTVRISRPAENDCRLIRIFDCLGREHTGACMFDEQPEGCLINIRSLSNGLYIVHVKGAKESSTLRFLKQ